MNITVQQTLLGVTHFLFLCYYHETIEINAPLWHTTRKLVLVVTWLTESTTCISGVYLTSLGPENSTEKLVGNNWDDLMPSPALVKDKEARTEWVVEVPQGRAQRVGRNRDVYLHRGDLELDGNCRIYRRSKPDEYWSCTLLWAW